MTRAPRNLLAVRSLLLTHLNIDKDAIKASDLEPGEVGIVGDANHRGGYHCGKDRLDASRDYSVVESARDSSGLTLNASALDVGMFSVVVGGRTHNLRTLSTWFVAQCVAGAADTRDIREIIYSPDGRTVKRWDRLKRRTTGDSRHLTHTHFSFFRDSTKAGRDQTPLFRRYLTTIGLIQGDDMSDKAENEIHQVYAGLFFGGNSMGRSVDLDGSGPAQAGNSLVAKLDYLLGEVDKQRLRDEAVLAAVKGLDTRAVLARINEVAVAETARDQAAAAERAALAELVRQGQSGELAAAEVVRLIGERLAADPAQQG